MQLPNSRTVPILLLPGQETETASGKELLLRKNPPKPMPVPEDFSLFLFLLFLCKKFCKASRFHL